MTYTYTNAENNGYNLDIVYDNGITERHYMPPDSPTWLQNVSTTNATQTTLHTFKIPQGKTYRISYRIIGRRTGGSAGTAGDTAVFENKATYKNVAGVVTQVGADDGFTFNLLLWSVAKPISGETLVLKVTGSANNNITWDMEAEVSII